MGFINMIGLSGPWLDNCLHQISQYFIFNWDIGTVHTVSSSYKAIIKLIQRYKRPFFPLNCTECNTGLFAISCRKTLYSIQIISEQSEEGWVGGERNKKKTKQNLPICIQTNLDQIFKHAQHLNEVVRFSKVLSRSHNLASSF